MHDPSIDRVSNERGLINNLSLNEIKQYQLLNGESIPEFYEVLNLLRHKCICKIDIKEPNEIN